jgi:hypothetical protein
MTATLPRRLALLVPLLLLTALPAAAQTVSRVFLGSWGPAGGGQGHVYRYEGGTAWTRLSPPLGLGDAVWDLEWHEDELWAVTHEGEPASSVDFALRPDTPHGSNGRVFRFDGSDWIDHSPPGGFGSGATTVSSMAGTLYVTVDRDGLYRWEGGTTWTLLGDFIMGAQALVSNSHDGANDLLYVGQDNTDEFWVHDPTGALPCGDGEGDPRSFRTDCQEPTTGLVCSADCWPGSCIHALAEYDDGTGPLVYGGAWERRMYRWDPPTRLFDRIEDVPEAPDNGQLQHVQGLASWRGRLWVGLSDGRLWAGADPAAGSYGLEHEFGPDWPISDLYVENTNDLLWIGMGAVPWRWARNDGTSRVWTFDGATFQPRSFEGAFGEGVLALLAVDWEIPCDAGPALEVECAGEETLVDLVGGEVQPPAAFGYEASYEWTGPFLEGSAPGPAATVTFPGPGAYPVTYTVTVGPGSSSCETTVTITDSVPPALGAQSRCLWPPNPRYHCFELAELTANGEAFAEDDCDGEVDVRIVDAWSSQPEDETGRGDGRTEDDLLFDGERICVRAERQGADPAGRDYVVVLESVDAAGNVARAEAVIHVPHDQRPEERCPPRPVDPGLLPKTPLPLDPATVQEGRYP